MMVKGFMFGLISKIICLFFGVFFFCSYAYAEKTTYVSLTPSITEIVYALGAQDNLVGVSTECNYPKEASLKTKIGNTFFVDREKIIRLKPDYVFSMESTQYLLASFKYSQIKPIFFKFDTIDDVYKNIEYIARLSNKTQRSEKLISGIKKQISESKTNSPKKILYLVQVNPMISIGKKSFITDVIQKSGQLSVTSNLNAYYPTISEEFAVKSSPDIVVVNFFDDTRRLGQLVPHSEIIILSDEERDIINRPGPRVYKSVQYFSKL